MSNVASLPANSGTILNTLYHEYQNFLAGGGAGDFNTSLTDIIVIQGSSVGVNVHGNGTGDFNALVTTLQNLGMKINATHAASQTVAGLITIDKLLTIAQDPQITSVTPQIKPITR